MRAAVGLPERDGLLVRGVEDGQPGRRGPGSSAATCSSASTGSPLTSVDELFDALEAGGDADPRRRCAEPRSATSTSYFSS